MVRAPCCEKIGLKRGPWAHEEDQILISYIQHHGHGNWRALPKQAGLLRCGKSCRLRWTNYLRPDIKRGNFSKEEEETIINLHQMLGNRWSAIAARLPGRTDNEIKNVWHTHLKKKLQNHQSLPKFDPGSSPESQPINPSSQTHRAGSSDSTASIESKPIRSSGSKRPGIEPVSPQDSSGDDEVSSVSQLPNSTGIVEEENENKSETFPQIDESFWSDELTSGFVGVNGDDLEFLFSSSSSPAGANTTMEGNADPYTFGDDDVMDFWYNLLAGAGGLQPQLPEF